MNAPWPKPLGEDFTAHYQLSPRDEEAAAEKFEVVNAGRVLRRDYNIASNKRVAFVLRTSKDMPAHDAEVIKLLLNAESLTLATDFTPEKGTPSALTPLGSLYLPLAGLIDVAGERIRIAKEIAKVEQELTKVATKLSSESFVGSAPAAVVEEHRQRQAEWQAKLVHLQKMLESMG